ncbi:PAS domain-containing protein [Lachnoclostridium sp. Marseille-P6806]|uniref:PAS domain-containing protein n=1 Tax=Lachnoclostridium sp. Marseille-P6806 TaxID=2364793 RepID=UPI0010321890|nr:PAS domain-containing protein [Lachnoclostridium sp. Marseille-P6806]
METAIRTSKLDLWYGTQQALRTGYGESRRYSETLMERLLYAAVRMEDESVLRLSVSQRSIWMLLLGILQPLLVMTALVGGISAFFSVRLSERIIRPLNFLDLEQPLNNAGFDELAPLLRRISSQQEELTRQERFLDQKQEELDTILEYMEEGLLLLDENGKLVRMNAAAREMLDIREEPAGKTLLSLCRQGEEIKGAAAIRIGAESAGLLSPALIVVFC